MGSVGDAYDNAVADSFFGTLQLELLDRHHWTSRKQLASAIFEWIETPHQRIVSRCRLSESNERFVRVVVLVSDDAVGGCPKFRGTRVAAR